MRSLRRGARKEMWGLRHVQRGCTIPWVSSASVLKGKEIERSGWDEIVEGKLVFMEITSCYVKKKTNWHSRGLKTSRTKTKRWPGFFRPDRMFSKTGYSWNLRPWLGEEWKGIKGKIEIKNDEVVGVEKEQKKYGGVDGSIRDPRILYSRRGCPGWYLH